MEDVFTSSIRACRRSVFLNCNYEVSDYMISCQFYHELFLWWSEFRKSFASESDWKIIVWNNIEIRIDSKPVYYTNYFKSGIIYIHNLLFNLNTMDSYNYFSKKIVKSNFLQWADLCHSVPSHLKEINPHRLTISPSLIIGNKIFDIKDKKSEDYYLLLVSKKAQPPNIIRKLKSDFNFTTQQFKEIFSLPHLVALESYIKAFQYKVINCILYTNSKLCKIGFRVNDACTFCNDEPENLYYLFYEYPPKRSGLISNFTGTFYRISQSIFLHKTFYLEFYQNNALYQIY